MEETSRLLVNLFMLFIMTGVFYMTVWTLYNDGIKGFLNDVKNLRKQKGVNICFVLLLGLIFIIFLSLRALGYFIYIPKNGIVLKALILNGLFILNVIVCTIKNKLILGTMISFTLAFILFLS